MKRSTASSASSRSRLARTGVVLAMFAFSPIARAEVRLLEETRGSGIAARGFTGIAGCAGTSCLDYNPALLDSPGEDVRVSLSTGFRFNEALFDTVDSWEDTKKIYSSNRYREILLTSWNFLSRQTAKTNIGLDVQVGGFAFGYAPVNFGTLLIAHDPVLPFGEIYNYRANILSAGYSFPFSFDLGGRALPASVGLSIRHASAEASRFTFDELDKDYDHAETSSGSWTTARLGASMTFDSRSNLVGTLVISGIPIHGAPPELFPANDAFDAQTGIASDLWSFPRGRLRGYYSFFRLPRQEDLLLKQRAGLEVAYGKLTAAAGLSDGLPTSGLSLDLPLFRFTFSTYGVEYSSLAHNLTDRVYWFELEF